MGTFLFHLSIVLSLRKAPIGLEYKLLQYEDWTLSFLLYIGPHYPLTCHSHLPCPLFSLQTLINTLSGNFPFYYELMFHYFLSR